MRPNSLHRIPQFGGLKGASSGLAPPGRNLTPHSAVTTVPASTHTRNRRPIPCCESFRRNIRLAFPPHKTIYCPFYFTIRREARRMASTSVAGPPGIPSSVDKGIQLPTGDGLTLVNRLSESRSPYVSCYRHCKYFCFG